MFTKTPETPEKLAAFEAIGEVTASFVNQCLASLPPEQHAWTAPMIAAGRLKLGLAIKMDPFVVSLLASMDGAAPEIWFSVARPPITH